MIGSRSLLDRRACRFALCFATAIAIALGVASAPAAPKQGATDDAFLEDLSRRSFAFFWEQTDPATGIVRDRSRTDGSPSSDNHVKVGSIASVGFGLTGMCIAAERGWQPREAVLERTRTTLRTFAERQAHEHGWFYHWVNVHTGAREWQSEVSSIDTALLHGRRAQRAPVLRRRSGDPTPRRDDLSPPRLRLDAQRPPDTAVARVAARERDDRAPLGRVQRSLDALPARARIADASAAGRLVACLGAADADPGTARPTSPTPGRSSCTSTRTRGSTSAAGAIPIRRTTGSPTASPRRGPTAATVCRSAIGSRAMPRTCGASRRPTRATATRRGAVRRPIRRSTVRSCPVPPPAR